MSAMPAMQVDTHAVMRVADADLHALRVLFEHFGLETQLIADGEPIPGSYWGESEAGLVRNTVYVRRDTPVHSMLHESCHYICMDAARRATLERDAGGDFAEEDAVCYLQILLADHVENMNRVRACADMDAWGYTFRLGSAAAWFAQDADSARQWLIDHGLIDAHGQLTWRVRF